MRLQAQRPRTKKRASRVPKHREAKPARGLLLGVLACLVFAVPQLAATPKHTNEMSRESKPAEPRWEFALLLLRLADSSSLQTVTAFFVSSAFFEEQLGPGHILILFPVTVDKALDPVWRIDSGPCHTALLALCVDTFVLLSPVDGPSRAVTKSITAPRLCLSDPSISYAGQHHASLNDMDRPRRPTLPGE